MTHSITARQDVMVNGCTAYEDGLSLKDNPYDKNMSPEFHSLWCVGFLDQEQVHKNLKNLVRLDRKTGYYQ